MALPASEVIAIARDRMLGFDTGFLADDTELLRRISTIQPDVLDRIIRLDRMDVVLPGDDNDAVDVSSYAASYALPATHWRIRQVRVNYSAGPPQPAFVVPSNWRHNFPERHPSLYIQGVNFYPIDGATSLATRVYGWADASTVEFDFVTEPVDVDEGTDNLALPDEAKRYVGADLAHWMGVRAKVAEATLRELRAERDTEEQKLFALLGRGDAA